MKAKQLLPIFLTLLLSASTLGFGCKKKKKDPNMISKAELKKRIRFCKPQCVNFCKNMVKVCADFLKKKKRTIKQRKCALGCFKKCIKAPYHIGPRLACSSKAKACQQFRNCNKCGRFSCKPSQKGKAGPKDKAGPKGKDAAGKAPAPRQDAADKGTDKKAAPADRREAPADRRAAPTDRREAPADRR